MSEKISKTRMVLAAFVWIAVLAGIVAGIKYIWWPVKQEQVKQQQIAEQEHIKEATKAKKRHSYSINFGIDEFSGYAPLRSTGFLEECSSFGVKVDLLDDGGNYPARLKALGEGKLDMAVFTIDSLIKTSADFGDCPATIVAIVDESKGMDGIVGYGEKFPNIDALNKENVRFVCLKDSPSETLVRLLITQFALENLPENPFEYAKNPQEIHEKFLASGPTDSKVFVTFEPYISKMLENPQYHKIIDTSKFSGYIVDTIVVRKGFLYKNRKQVEQIVKSYFTAMYSHRKDLSFFLKTDPAYPSTEADAAQKVKTILWKNAQENYSHFGLLQGHKLIHIEDMVANIMKVQLKTKAINHDPTGGDLTGIYNDSIVSEMFNQNWHPGIDTENVASEKALPALSEEEWGELKPVGTLQTPKLVFSRGSAKFTVASETTLTSLLEKLQTWPQYYLIIRGSTISSGDVEANMTLALERSEATKEWLVSKGVDSNRIRVDAIKANGSTTVSFVLGETPY